MGRTSYIDSFAPTSLYPMWQSTSLTLTTADAFLQRLSRLTGCASFPLPAGQVNLQKS